ncbi:uncharacterized protein SCHCODRAFT_02274122 [Schizophyllum commune H4-8]|uniref:uncharacterized protein n=1 Tax=Schizophyllum commune (strain H4-8 / FGSC 9210) TaxID=578458 RepID=UPI00215EB59F|nr:uncharacterized protein SCHCODRAFT_02274122 [Schizophyllum commune H4-8]KAI5894320.1 hypothetical protein SCHCODRAFT_02274122 [Schizophyllum commune H4-8]
MMKLGYEVVIGDWWWVKCERLFVRRGAKQEGCQVKRSHFFLPLYLQVLINDVRHCVSLRGGFSQQGSILQCYDSMIPSSPGMPCNAEGTLHSLAVGVIIAQCQDSGLQQLRNCWEASCTFLGSLGWPSRCLRTSPA